MVLIMKKELKIFLTFFLVYILFAQSYGWSEVTRLDLIMAVVDDGSFSIDSFYQNTGDRAVINESYYADKAPGLSFLALPVYTVFKHLFGRPVVGNWLYAPFSQSYAFLMFLCVIFTSAFFGALSVVLVYKITGFFPAKEIHRNIVFLTYGLGSLVFVYSRIFQSHVLSAFLGVLCFYLLLKMKYEKQSKDYSFVIGLLAGFAVMVDYVMILFLVLLFVLLFFYFKDWKKSLKFIFGSLIFIILILLYNFSITGSLFDSPYFHMDTSFWDKGGGVTQQFNPVVSSIPFVFMRVLFFPYRGLFFYYPVLLFSVIGLFFMFKKYKFETMFIFFLSLGFVLYNSIMHTWWGGYCFGPRHLTPLMPFLMIPLLFSLKKIKLRYIMPFIIISIFFNLLSLQLPEEAGLGKTVDNLVPFGNPLFEHYLPLTLSQGPQSLLLEQVLNVQIIPWFNVATLLLIVYFIWRRELHK
ncbi:MAG: hypothetical protein KKF89_03970 [Nanoarchaeota archaeon]|nr:hypothetical protein [Nanoarchaeota archaeon]